MIMQEKELLIARIMSGYSRLNVNGEIYLLYPPSIEDKYGAEQLYNEIYNEAVMGGMMTEEEVLGMLVEFGLWNEEKENELQELEKQIEDQKVSLNQYVFQSVQRELTRKHLQTSKKRLSELYESRHAYDYISAQGLASLARTRYLMCVGLKKKNGQKYFEGDFYNQPDHIIDSIMEEYYRNLISETDYRELARTEPWRMTWGLKKMGASLTNSSCYSLSPEQKTLFFWSIIYDNVYESPDCPPESIINDDDMLDGWLIIQRRKRDDALERKNIENSGKISDKIKNAQEVYLMANTFDDAKKIDKMNDEMARATKRQRMATLRKMGNMNELDMPDTKREIQMQFTQKLRDRFK